MHQLRPDAGANLALAAGYHAVTLVGLPMTAATVGWLLAGREPPTIAHRRLE